MLGLDMGLRPAQRHDERVTLSAGQSITWGRGWRGAPTRLGEIMLGAKQRLPHAQVAAGPAAVPAKVFPHALNTASRGKEGKQMPVKIDSFEPLSKEEFMTLQQQKAR